MLNLAVFVKSSQNVFSERSLKVRRVEWLIPTYYSRRHIFNDLFQLCNHEGLQLPFLFLPTKYCNTKGCWIKNQRADYCCLLRWSTFLKLCLTSASHTHTFWHTAAGQSYESKRFPWRTNSWSGFVSEFIVCQLEIARGDHRHTLAH